MQDGEGLHHDSKRLSRMIPQIDPNLMFDPDNEDEQFDEYEREEMKNVTIAIVCIGAVFICAVCALCYFYK